MPGSDAGSVDQPRPSDPDGPSDERVHPDTQVPLTPLHGSLAGLASVMTDRSQPSLFDAPLDFDVDDVVAGSEAAAGEARDAAAREGLAVSRLHLNASAGRQLDERERWRRLRGQKGRRLPPRQPIPEQARLLVLTTDGYQ